MAFVFLLFGLSFTLECATAALTVGKQKCLGLLKKKVDLLTVKRIFCLKYVL